MNDMVHQRLALDEARRVRAEHLMAVHEGVLTPLDVIDAAHNSSATALRKIRLDQLILAVDGTSIREWQRVRDLTLAVLDLQVPDRDLTIGWLIDPRAGGRRLHALRDVMRKQTAGPWHQFPWSGAPSGDGSVGGGSP